MKTSVTIKDIANIAQVSTATVSRYINNASSVSSVRAEKILEAIEKSGYVPNELARGLTKNTSTVIGLVMPDINNIFFPTVVIGIENELENYGFNTLICNSQGNTEKEANQLKMLMARKVAGIISIGTRPTEMKANEHLIAVSKQVPLLLINDFFSGHDISYIMTDEVQGMMDAVHYIYELGHRRIAFFNGNFKHTTYAYKKQGYTKACKELALESEKYVFEVDPYEKGGYLAMQHIINIKNDRPTAIIAANDQMAIGAIRAVSENGFTIPGDFSLIGFSNAPISEEVYPQLTTVDQYPYEIGKTAANMMIDIIKYDNLKTNSILLKTKLVIRNTCTVAKEK